MGNGTKVTVRSSLDRSAIREASSYFAQDGIGRIQHTIGDRAQAHATAKAWDMGSALRVMANPRCESSAIHHGQAIPPDSPVVKARGQGRPGNSKNHHRPDRSTDCDHRSVSGPLGVVAFGINQ